MVFFLSEPLLLLKLKLKVWSMMRKEMQMRNLMLKKLVSSCRRKLIKNLRREVMELREQLEKEKEKDSS